MEATTVGFGIAEFLLLLFSGQLLGLPPGERDPALMKSAPAAAYAYCEWAASGPGVEGLPGIEGLIADPEIKTLLTVLESTLDKATPDSADHDGELEKSLRTEVPKLLLLAARHPGAVYLAGSDAPIGESHLVPLEAALILNLGEDRVPFLAGLNRVLRLIPGFAPPAKLDHTVIPLPGVAVMLHEDGPRLIVTVGTGTMASLQDRWQQPNSELAGVPAFAGGWKAAKTPRVGSIAWLNLAQVRGDLQQKFGLPGTMIHGVAKSLGLSGIDSVMTVSGLDQQNMVCRTHVAMSGKAEGLLTLTAGRAIMAADLSQIPADADFVAAGSLDLQAVHRSLREIVTQAAPDMLGAFDEFQKQLEQELQLKLDDVFQGFGDVWTVYDAPSTGGLLLSGMVASVPVRDADRAESVFRRVTEMVAENLPLGSDGEGTTLKEIPFAGETIRYLNSTGYTVRYEGHPPISPAFCLTKQHVLFALHPLALKAHLRFLQSKEPRFSAVMKQKIPLSGGEHLAVLYADTPAIGRAIYPLIPLLAKTPLAELQAQGVPIDLGIVPSARAVLPYLQETAITVARQPDGLMIEQRNALPLWLALMFVPRLGGPWSESHDSEGILLEGRDGATLGTPAVQLGAAEGVVPAKAEAPAKPDVKEPTAIEKAARRTVPALVRGLIPDNIEALIPGEVFQKLAAPPDPEKAAQRAADRQRRKEARAAKKAARLAK